MAHARAQLPFNPAVLAWARRRAGLSMEDAAAKAGVAPTRLVGWEAGEAVPTPRQARLLAKHYKRPFLEFFAKEIPQLQEVELVPDYRFHKRAAGPNERRKLREVQAWAEEQRLNALDLFDMLGEQPERFPRPLYADPTDDVDQIAERTRDFLAFPIDDQTGLAAAQKYTLPSIIRARFSSCHVLVLKESTLGKLRTRGLCLFADPLPVILYGHEAPGAQAFTLAHEFGHILLRRSAISADPRFGRTGNRHKRVEGWCNRFAAAFLMPKAAVHGALSRPSKPAAAMADDTIAALARLFGVSHQAMLIRLVTLNYVEARYYWRVKRADYVDEEAQWEAPPARSRYYGTRYKNRLGDDYTGLVMEAWSAGALTAHNAAAFMGIKDLRHLNHIRHDVSS